MNYPVWYLPEVGGGTLVALIAVFHVFISHFAVGGGLYLVMAEKKGLRECNDAILAFTRRHARFFLLVTMIFGSISGVGIWFIIALANPAGTSLLIHNFVFGWAAEWVFFVVEIAAAFVYFYMFGRMDSSTHLKVGYLYFFAAWMSLFLINGIIGAMLTPGSWVETGNFWQGFFNPSFWPSLFFRTFVAVMMAGCYGYLTASWSRDEEVRVRMTRFSGLWSLAALAGVIPAGAWYIGALPAQAQALVLGKSPTIVSTFQYGTAAVILLLAITLIAGIIRPLLNNRVVALVAMAAAFVALGAFEWTREAARRPFVLNDLLYSNSIPVHAVDKLKRDGYLNSALWLENRELNEENRMAAGRELYVHQCYSCHTLRGRNNDIVALTENMSYPALASYIEKIHSVRYFMPPFAGTTDEARALAAFLAGEVHGKEIMEPAAAADEPLAAGRQVFELHCSACHAEEDVAPAFAGEDQAGIRTMLLSLNEISEEMEPFPGDEKELATLGEYLFSLNNEPPVTAESGKPVFENHCSACHAVDELAGMTAEWSREEIFENLGRLEELSEEMPPFEGSMLEREMLADYLEKLKGGE